LPVNIAYTKLEFWPWLQEGEFKGAEPDVLIWLDDQNGPKWLVLIEAKYFSGKSSEATAGGFPNDQLAKEMANLRLLAQRNRIQRYALVYVTADVSLPASDLEDAISELRNKIGDGSAEQFYWTSWRNVPDILNRAKPAAATPGELALITDAIAIMERLGLTRFSGINSKGWTVGAMQWQFRRPLVVFTWPLIPSARYRLAPTAANFAWNSGILPQEALWRWHNG
jgi:hypothetical protein